MENVMRRIVEKDLLRWKDGRHRKPLVVRGARQVGKTWSIKHLGETAFDDMVVVDLEKRADLCPIFDGNLSADNIVESIEIATGKRIRAGETLLFLDEVQECPRALMALRYLYEEKPDLHVIAAGSLLEFAFGEIKVPVGRLSYLNMYPMTFAEYLVAMGNKPAAEAVMSEPGGLPESTHATLLNALKRYFFVGGLPECVSLVAEGASLLDVFAVQDDILNAYRDDFAKYAARADKSCLNAVLLNLARQVGQQIKYTTLDHGHTGPTNRKAFDLLRMARVVHKVPSATPLAPPLGASANEKRFKALFVDIGLMQRACCVPVDREMNHDDLLDIYRGRLAEQFVGQELLATHDGDLFYWSRESRGSQAEVDFAAMEADKVHPVEVKSGKAGKLRSLHMALEKHPDCGDGIVLNSGNFGRMPEQRLVFIPLYYAGSLGPKPNAL